MMFSCNYLALAWIILVLTNSSSSTQQSPVSTFRRKSYIPDGSELLCSHIQGSRDHGGQGRLSYVYVSTSEYTSDQHLVLVDEKYSQLHQGGLVSRSSCRWSWPSLHLTLLKSSWSTESHCRRAVLKPLDDRRLGLALVASDGLYLAAGENVTLELVILDATNCTWTKVTELQQRSKSNVDLRSTLWMLNSHWMESPRLFEVIFDAQEWQESSQKCTNAEFCALIIDAMSGEEFVGPRGLRSPLVKFGEEPTMRWLPVRSGGPTGLIVFIETTDDLIIEIFDTEGASDSHIREPKPRGSLQLVVQTIPDEDYYWQFISGERLGTLLRYCWLLEGGRAECTSRGPALDLRSSVSLILGHEGFGSGSLLELPRLGDSGEDFLLLTQGGSGEDYDRILEAPYYLTKVHRNADNSSHNQWQRSQSLEMVLLSGLQKPFLASGDADSDSYCSIGSTVKGPWWEGRGVSVEIRCVPLRFLLESDA